MEHGAGGLSKSLNIRTHWLGGMVAHKILVTAQVLGFGIWIGLWPRACQLSIVSHLYVTEESAMMKHSV